MKQHLCTPAFAAGALAMLLAGCGGGAGPASVPSAAGASDGRGSATIVIKIPDPAAPAVAKRRPSYISASTQSVAIAVYPSGGTPPAQPTSVVDLTPASPNCTGSPRSCTIQLSAPFGNDAFRFTLYDRPGGSGNVLATGTVSATIGPNPQPLDVTLDGVPASISLQLSQNGVFAHVPASVTLIVNAKDADGNLIVAPGAFSVPIALQVNDPAGALTFPRTVSGPAASPVTVAYNGNASVGTVFTFSAATSDGAIQSAAPAPALTVNGGVAAQYSQGISAGSGLQGIVKAADGNFWFCEQFVNRPPSFIGVMTPQGNVIHQFALPSGGFSHHLELPWVIINGPSADPQPKVWIVAEGGIGSLRVSDGAITEYPYPSGFRVLNVPGATVGPDNAIWFTEGITDFATIGRLDPNLPPNSNPANGPLNPHEFTGLIATSRHPNAIVAGPDGNLWFTENGDPGFVARYNLHPPSGVAAGTVTEFPTPTANSRPTGITVAPDGTLWFMETAVNKLARISPATATPSSPGIVEIPNGAAANGIVPRADAISIITQPDGTIWFGEDARDGYLGRLDPSTSTITQIAIPNVDVQSLAADAAGSLWFTESFNTPDRIGHFVY